MMTADDELALVRPSVVEAVRALRERGFSQMRAYETFGSMVGKSPTWVRGIVGRDPSVGVRLRDALNIRTAYDRLCARVEAAAERVEAENQHLREALDVALSARGAPPSGARGARVAPPAASRGEPERAASVPLVRPAVGAPRHPRSRSGQAAELNDLPLWRAAEGE